jgi:thiol-disulfide isomerase/thioredoxin
MNTPNSFLVQLAFIAVASAGVYSFVRAARDGEERRVCVPVCSMGPDYAGLNRTVPDFELTDLSGKKVRISDYRGKVVIVNFWTKTCRPCLEEMPALAELAKILNGYEDIEFLTVTTDESAQDALDTLRSVLGQQVVTPTGMREDANFTTLVDSESNVVRGLFGTRLFPETWFIDPSGVIRARIDGPRDWRAMAPLTIDFANSIKGPLSCDVEIERRVPQGKQCEGIPTAG